MWAAAAFLLFLQADYTTEGMKALDEGKYEAAVQAFRKAIEADSKDYFAHFILAMADTLLHLDPEALRTEYVAGSSTGLPQRPRGGFQGLLRPLPSGPGVYAPPAGSGSRRRIS